MAAAEVENLKVENSGRAASEPVDVWTGALEHLRVRVSQEAFDTWLAPTRGLELTKNQIRVEVPNAFFADWVGQHYAAEINQALRTVTGREISVCFHARDIADAAVLQRRSWQPRTAVKQEGYRLQARHTFTNFIVGDSARLAYAAARNVAERPGQTYNPLFLYGGAGLGKTHLLQAIGNHALKLHQNLKVYYVAAETLFLELIHAIEKGTRLDFKGKYRSLDLLLLDDVHYLVGKERLQEEIFHIFNHLHDSGSQVVFTSDQPPKDIPTLEERLASRLGSGLVVDIQPPDLETRIAILKQKAALEEQELPHEVAHYVAAKVRSNVRELEGCLIRILAMASLSSRPVSVKLAEEALKDIVGAERPVTRNAVIAAAAAAFEVSVADVKGAGRTKQLVLARQVAMYLLRKKMSLSLKEIGTCFGNRDHTTVMHAIEKIERLRINDTTFAGQLEKLFSGINRG